MTQSMTSQTIPALRLVWPLLRFVQRHRSPETAGRRVASLVASPQAATTGQYFERNPTPRHLPARHLDPAIQQRTWQLGCDLVAEARTHSRAR